MVCLPVSELRPGHTLPTEWLNHRWNTAESLNRQAVHALSSIRKSLHHSPKSYRCIITLIYKYFI
jgi:hypothetical protein